jgi:hypothetical protein
MEKDKNLMKRVPKRSAKLRGRSRPTKAPIAAGHVIELFEAPEIPLPELAEQIAAFRDIDSIRLELSSMRDMQDDLRKKLFCLGVITDALGILNKTIVLFGGTAVEYYLSGGYQGKDVDISGTNEALGILKLLGFNRTTGDHWGIEGFPWTIHFSEEDIIGEDVNTLKINEKYQVHIIRVERAIFNELWKIVEGDDCNSYYGRARDMIKCHQTNINWSYLHELAEEQSERQSEQLKAILRTIEALLDLKV